MNSAINENSQERQMQNLAKQMHGLQRLKSNPKKAKTAKSTAMPVLPKTAYWS